MSSQDVVKFITAAGCQAAAEEVVDKIISFGGSEPTEGELLARCRHVFEYILHDSLRRSGRGDLADFEVEIQTEKESG